jgi:hypothetical protein
LQEAGEGPQEPGGPVPFQPPRFDQPPPPPDPPPAPPRKRRGRTLDRVVGILLGILLGIGVVVAFVFLGSEGTIDAPRISGVQKQPARHPTPQRPAKPKPPQSPRGIPTIEVIGGAPPQSGPVKLDFKRGEEVRFRVDTDAALGIEIPGYGISETVDTGALVAFRATRAGQFPVIVAASHINIASLNIR